MTTIADAPDDLTVEELAQDVANLTEQLKERNETLEDLHETVERQAMLIERYERRLIHLREERVIEANLGGGGQ